MPPYLAPYAPLNAYVAPARSRAELWRTVSGLLIAGIFGFLSVQAILVSLMAALGPELARSTVLGIATGSTPQGVTALLFCYVPLLAGLALGLGLMMRRGLGSLIGPLAASARNFLWVALPLSALWVALMPLSLMAGNVAPNLTLLQQAPWLPFVLIGLLVQTGTEEMLFRGYLQQQLAARFAARWVWMGVPALLFGLAHYSSQQYGYMAILVVLFSALFGLAAADLTARTGNLGAAVGLHFANNVSAVLLVGLKGKFGGMALYNATVDHSDIAGELTFLAVDAVALVVSWLAARLILRV